MTLSSHEGGKLRMEDLNKAGLKDSHNQRLLKIEHLVKHYGRVMAVSDVSLEVNVGEIVGFVGPNGAGKTTTMRTVLGFLKPTSGKIYLFGQLVTGKNAHKLLRDIGYVPGEVNSYGDVPVKKILEFYASFYERFDWSYCEKLCNMFGVELNKKFEDLSLGNKKKVAIVTAFAHKPRLFILDEPTNSLDPFVQKKLYALLEEVRQSGAGVLFSSHVLEEVERMCDRVVFIKDGRTVEAPGFKGTVRKVTVWKESQPPNDMTDVLCSFPGVLEVRSENGARTFLFDGQPKKLLELLAKLEPDDLLIEQLSLDDIFEGLYGSDVASVETQPRRETNESGGDRRECT